MENWQEIGISTAAYYLDALLMKPGYSVLKSLASLQSYCGWSGAIVLNASFVAANSEGIYIFRSLYDGSRISISQNELFSLIIDLQPDLVILPPGFNAYLSEQHLSFPPTITAYRPAYEIADTEKGGIFLAYEKTESFIDFFRQFQQYKARPIYLSGALNLMQAYELIEHGAQWLESDKPASDALLALVYGETNNFSLLDSDMANQHQPIIAHCECPTCSQKLTRAYLHHLFLQTPLLCQRFLIQHNAHFYKNQIESMLKEKRAREDIN
jgi:queuine tRNA-ribosyltransferase